MPLIDVVQIVLLVALVVAAAKPVGTFLFSLYSGERTFLHPVLAPVERAIYRVAGVDPSGEMTLGRRTRSRCCCSRAVCVVVLFAAAAPAGHPAAEPRRRARHAEPARVQHRRLVRHQHQLAGVLRRESA